MVRLLQAGTDVSEEQQVVIAIQPQLVIGRSTDVQAASLASPAQTISVGP